MSILTKLHIGEQELNILRYKLSVIQNADYTGRPSSKSVVQPIEITYETIKNDPFYEKMASGKMTDRLKLVTTSVQMNAKTTSIELLDFYVLDLLDNFDGVNSKPMTTSVKISFASLVVNDVVMDVKYWRENDPRLNTAAPTQINRDNEENKAQEETAGLLLDFDMSV